MHLLPACLPHAAHSTPAPAAAPDAAAAAGAGYLGVGGSLLTGSGSDADWATLGVGSSDWGSSYDGMGAALGGGGGGGDGFVSSLKSQDYADGLVNEVGAAQGMQGLTRPGWGCTHACLPVA
jgi:hypothetical protein